MSDWMFEAAATPQPMIGDDAAPGAWRDWSEPASADHRDADPAFDGGKGGLTEFDLMMFGVMGGADNADGGEDDEATTIDDVVVDGTRIERDDPYNDWWETGGFPTGSTGGGPGGDENVGGTGGQDPGTQAEALEDRIFQTEDCATGAIRAEINKLPTNNSAEHSAATYRDANGEFRSTPVFPGSSGRAPVDQLILWLVANDIDFSQLASVYHNHDAASTNNADVSRYPSHLFAANGTGDWVMADLFVNPNAVLGQAGGADPNIFKLTIEDSQGKARDFSYADREKYKAMTQQEMEAGKDLPSEEGGCSGGT